MPKMPRNIQQRHEKNVKIPTGNLHPSRRWILLTIIPTERITLGIAGWIAAVIGSCCYTRTSNYSLLKSTPAHLWKLDAWCDLSGTISSDVCTRNTELQRISSYQSKWTMGKTPAGI